MTAHSASVSPLCNRDDAEGRSEDLLKDSLSLEHQSVNTKIISISQYRSRSCCCVTQGRAPHFLELRLLWKPGCCLPGCVGGVRKIPRNMQQPPQLPSTQQTWANSSSGNALKMQVPGLHIHCTESKSQQAGPKDLHFNKHPETLALSGKKDNAGFLSLQILGLFRLLCG